MSLAMGLLITSNCSKNHFQSSLKGHPEIEFLHIKEVLLYVLLMNIYWSQHFQLLLKQQCLFLSQIFLTGEWTEHSFC